MKENQIILINELGEEELANILFTHENEGRNYVVFEFVESLDITAAIYEENEDGEGNLIEIETEQEWEMLNDLLDNYYDELEENEEEQ